MKVEIKTDQAMDTTSIFNAINEIDSKLKCNLNFKKGKVKITVKEQYDSESQTISQATTESIINVIKNFIEILAHRGKFPNHLYNSKHGLGVMQANKVLNSSLEYDSIENIKIGNYTITEEETEDWFVDDCYNHEPIEFRFIQEIKIKSELFMVFYTLDIGISDGDNYVSSIKIETIEKKVD